MRNIRTRSRFDDAGQYVQLRGPVIALLLHEPLTLVRLISGDIALVGVALMIDRK